MSGAFPPCRPFGADYSRNYDYLGNSHRGDDPDPNQLPHRPFDVAGEAGVDGVDARGIAGERRDALVDSATNLDLNQELPELALHWAYPPDRRFDGERLP